MTRICAHIQKGKVCRRHNDASLQKGKMRRAAGATAARCSLQTTTPLLL